MASNAPTLKMVAEAAGVHLSTVSRVLDPARRHLVSEAVAQRIEDAARAIGYQRDMAAAALRTRRSRLVGVLVPDIANPVFAPIIAGITGELFDAGYSTIVADVGKDGARQPQLIADLLSRRADGLILATALLDDPAARGAHRSGTPVVLVNRATDGEPVPAVTSDERRGMGLVIDHLAGLGHKRIAHLAGPQIISTGAQRRAGFDAAMRRSNLTPDPLIMVEAGAYDIASGRAAAEKLLASGQRFTAIATANDLLAIGAIQALGARNLICPRDISVTGFNDMPLIDMIEPPLTTVRIAGQEMGRAAAAMLLQRIQAPGSVVEHRLLAPELVVRRSTAPAST
jgi:LacI family transcriptional regulator